MVVHDTKKHNLSTFASAAATEGELYSGTEHSPRTTVRAYVNKSFNRYDDDYLTTRKVILFQDEEQTDDTVSSLESDETVLPVVESAQTKVDHGVWSQFEGENDDFSESSSESDDDDEDDDDDDTATLLQRAQNRLNFQGLQDEVLDFRGEWQMEKLQREVLRLKSETEHQDDGQDDEYDDDDDEDGVSFVESEDPDIFLDVDQDRQLQALQLEVQRLREETEREDDSDEEQDDDDDLASLETEETETVALLERAYDRIVHQDEDWEDEEESEGTIELLDHAKDRVHLPFHLQSQREDDDDEVSSLESAEDTVALLLRAQDRVHMQELQNEAHHFLLSEHLGGEGVKEEADAQSLDSENTARLLDRAHLRMNVQQSRSDSQDAEEEDGNDLLSQESEPSLQVLLARANLRRRDVGSKCFQGEDNNGQSSHGSKPVLPVSHDSRYEEGDDDDDVSSHESKPAVSAPLDRAKDCATVTQSPTEDRVTEESISTGLQDAAQLEEKCVCEYRLPNGEEKKILKIQKNLPCDERDDPGDDLLHSQQSKTRKNEQEEKSAISSLELEHANEQLLQQLRAEIHELKNALALRDAELEKMRGQLQGAVPSNCSEIVSPIENVMHPIHNSQLPDKGIPPLKKADRFLCDENKTVEIGSHREPSDMAQQVEELKAMHLNDVEEREMRHRDEVAIKDVMIARLEEELGRMKLKEQPRKKVSIPAFLK